MSNDVNEAGNVRGEQHSGHIAPNTRTLNQEGKVLYETPREDPNYDFINPKHYQKQFNGAGIQVADVADIWDLNRWEFAALKHLLRQDKPGNERVLDLDKLIWYATRERNRVQAELETES